MADVAVVGRFAGSIALGAVGSTTTLVTLFTGLLIGMAGGVNVLVARFYGAKKEKRRTGNNTYSSYYLSFDRNSHYGTGPALCKWDSGTVAHEG